MKLITRLFYTITILLGTFYLSGHALSQQTSDAPSAQQMPDKPAKFKNWSKLHKGMTPKEVDKLIGPFASNDGGWQFIMYTESCTDSYRSGGAATGGSAIYMGNGFTLVFSGDWNLKSWKLN